MSVPYPAFFFFEEDDHGYAQGQCARGLPQIFSCGVRQRAHLVYLRRCGHGDGRPVSGAGRYGGAAVVLKPGLSAYTPFIGGDVHEALESLFVRGGIPAADGGEDDRPGGGRRCARGAAAGHQCRR